MKHEIESMRQAAYHVSTAIHILEQLKNPGIDNGATKPLRNRKDWLLATAKTLEDMQEIERVGEEQR